MELPLNEQSTSKSKGLFSGLLPLSPVIKPMEDLNESISSFQLSPNSSLRSGASLGTFGIKFKNSE